jgi:hypothetical protein
MFADIGAEDEDKSATADPSASRQDDSTLKIVEACDRRIFKHIGAPTTVILRSAAKWPYNCHPEERSDEGTAVAFITVRTGTISLR